jgi:hypothetical protein
MNAKHLVAAFAVLAATGSVFAQEFVAPDANYPVIKNSGTPKTRAEVNAEIAQARADGTLHVKEATYPVHPVAAGTKTRTEVRAELEQYQKAYPNGQATYRGS